MTGFAASDCSVEFTGFARGEGMSDIHEFGLKLRFSGGDADDSKLELYDGTTSLYGFSQALQIAMHAYVHHEIVTRATAMKGISAFVRAPRNGSVLFDILAIIEQYPAVASISAPIFYDFLKYAFSKAAGYLNAAPETNYVSRMSTDDEPFFDDLAETLEGSLQRGHRSIDGGTATSITLERPRSVLVKFDKSSSEWVNTRDEAPAVEELDGNVTRYNSITGNGRAYINELHTIIPFRLSPEFPGIKRGYLTWSLHGNTAALPKALKFHAKKVKSARNDVKRIILCDVVQMEAQTPS